MECRCKNCGKEYDNNMFPVCPFCSAPDPGMASGDMFPANTPPGDTFPGDTDLLIKDAFPDNKYKRFVKYCSDQGMTLVSQLEDFDFEELYQIPGLGKGKINSIIAHYQTLQEASLTPEGREMKSQQMEDERLFKTMHDDLKECSLSILLCYGFRPRQLNILQKNGYDRIGSLENAGVRSLSELTGRGSIEKYRMVSEIFESNLQELFENILKSDTGKDEFIFTLLKAEGYTLQEIGQLKQVTRERSRQIINKYIKRIDPFMKPLTDHYLDQKGYVTVQEIMDIYDNDDFEKIMLYWCKYSGYLQYIDFADVFVSQDTDLKKLELDLIEIAEDYIEDGIKFTDYVDDLNNELWARGYPYLDADLFVNYLLNNRYRMYGDFLIKGRQSYGYLCSRIVADKFPNGIKAYDKHDMDLLREYAMEEYGDIGLADDDRSLSTRVIEYLVLCGRGLYTAEENVYVEMDLLEEIKDYIDTCPEAEIYYSELFAKYQDKISIMSNINNYNFLHGVLKLYYPDEYDFSNRDHLTKRGEGLISGRLNFKLREFMIEMGRPVHRKEIHHRFPGVTDIVLTNAINNDDILIQWDSKTFSSLEVVGLSEEEIESIYNIIKSLAEETNGYCSERKLYSTIQDSCPDIIVNNEMESPSSLFYTCAKLFKDEFDFRRPHICRKGMLDAEELSVKSVAMHMLGYPQKLSFYNYLDIADRLQWSPITASLMFAEIENGYVRVSPDEYIKKEAVIISHRDIEAVYQVVRKRMREGYLSLITMEFDSTFPELNYEWNIHLLRSLVEAYIPALKIVEPRAKDRRYERGIIIDARNPANNVVDLVVHQLKKRGLTEIPESKMLSYMITNGFAYKLIPKDFYVSDRIEYGKGMFYIK